jgi:hypothetical protein
MLIFTKSGNHDRSLTRAAMIVIKKCTGVIYNFLNWIWKQKASVALKILACTYLLVN